MTPKNGHEGKDANNSLKWGGMRKRGKGHKWWGCWKRYCKMQKFVLQKSE